MISLKDNTPVPAEKDLKKLCQDIQKQIYTSNCTLVDLLESSDQEDTQKAKRPKIFQYWDDGTYAVGNYVGQLEYHGKDGTVERIIIGARGPGFPGADDKNKALRNQQGSFLLRTMLEDCWEIPLHFLESTAEIQQGDPYSALLAVRLAAQLDRAWRKGALRFYRTLPRRDSRIQGRLDIAREIRQSMGLQDGRMAYEIREFTDNNDYHRLFLQACVEAERQYPNLMLHMRKLLPGYHTAFQSLNSAPWGKLDTSTLLNKTRKKITNSIYRDYEILRTIARSFLIRQGTEVQAVNTSNTPFVTGILLDLSQLWERYLLKKVLPPGTEHHYQQNKHIMGKNMWVIPDFLWEKDDHKKISGVVLDAKYKFKWGDTLKQYGQDWTEFIHKDVYQVLAYMLELNCAQGGVVFPVDKKNFLQNCGISSMADLKSDRLQIPVGQPEHKMSNSFTFWRFPFAVPSEESNYNAFRQAMDQEAQRLSQQIAEQLFKTDHTY